jgi:hypothetical protein
MAVKLFLALAFATLVAGEVVILTDANFEHDTQASMASNTPATLLISFVNVSRRLRE